MEKITDTIVSVLSRIWRESKEYEFGSPEQMLRFNAFAKILDSVRQDFDEDFMVKMYQMTCEEVDEFIGTIPGFLVKALEKRGMFDGKITHFTRGWERPSST
jgi:hypothetical protein